MLPDHLYIYPNGINTISPNRIEDILLHVAQETDTRDLVVALYLFNNRIPARGTAYARDWLEPKAFTTGRGHWAFTKSWPIPKNIPSRFKLIRLQMSIIEHTYPKTENDIYGWQFQYNGFDDHLAVFFAHELHHFRRYHHNLHTGEGEQKANHWAVARVRELGFHVEAQQLPVKKRKKHNRIFPKFDKYAAFRNLQQNDRVRINHDPRNHYLNESAIVVRPIRSNSKRLVIRTSDGKIWRWPLHWVTPL